ncbi:MAG TPA: hypothetical protein VL404_01755, partial [Candidatus Eisenbacteria bacterium]|nr:hypothetical protein [Candidatus Eisenbacteria bacterium]
DAVRFPEKAPAAPVTVGARLAGTAYDENYYGKIASQYDALSSKYSAESRAYVSPWMRVVRGTAIGQHPIPYDRNMAGNLRSTLKELGAKVPPQNSYNRFATVLTDLILTVNDPSTAKTEEVLKQKTEEVIAALGEIRNPGDYVTASAVLFDSFAKLGLGDKAIVNETRDLVGRALETLGRISAEPGDKGAYERLTSHASLFLAIGQLGLKSRLTSGHDYIQDSLNQIGQVPSAYYRGRGASALFTTLGVLGLSHRATDGPIDYVKAVLDFLDAELDHPEAEKLKRSAFKNSYPLLTMANAVSVMGKPEYLTYRRDWLKEAKGFVERFDAPTRHLGQYYLMALRNAGKLDEYVPDLPAFLKEWGQAWAGYQSSEADALLYQMSDVYAIETANFFGHPELVRQDLIDRAVNKLRAYKPGETYRNAAYGGSYVLTALGELGKADLLFKPNPNFEGEAPMLWSIRHYTAETSSITLPYLNNAIIGYALRMRGPAAATPPVFRNFEFRYDFALKGEKGSPRLVISEQKGARLAAEDTGASSEPVFRLMYGALDARLLANPELEADKESVFLAARVFAAQPGFDREIPLKFQNGIVSMSLSPNPATGGATITFFEVSDSLKGVRTPIGRIELAKELVGQAREANRQALTPEVTARSLDTQFLESVAEIARQLRTAKKLYAQAAPSLDTAKPVLLRVTTGTSADLTEASRNEIEFMAAQRDTLRSIAGKNVFVVFGYNRKTVDADGTERFVFTPHDLPISDVVPAEIADKAAVVSMGELTDDFVKMAAQNGTGVAATPRIGDGEVLPFLAAGTFSAINARSDSSQPLPELTQLWVNVRSLPTELTPAGRELLKKAPPTATVETYRPYALRAITKIAIDKFLSFARTALKAIASAA